MTFAIQTNVALAPLSTLKTGGEAAYFTEISSIEDLEKAVVFIHERQLPFCVLGGGSNVLIKDEGYAGLVMHMQIKGVTYSEPDSDIVLVTAAAGEVWDDLVADTVSRGFWGLENLSHIPGSVGATPVQNVGAYGVEVADIIKRVTVFDTETKSLVTFDTNDCQFSYRHSIFKEKPNLVIVSVTFAVSTTANPKVSYADLASKLSDVTSPTEVRSAVIEIRASKFPDWTRVGTAGSFFKNPIVPPSIAEALLLKYPGIPHYPAEGGMVKLSLGYILDKICGLKGFAIGPVRLFEKQALVLVSDVGATTADIKNFKKIISEKVFEKTSVVISPEVTEI